jgi:hypothetical protein
VKNKTRYKHVDKNGKRLHVGDRIRVIGFHPKTRDTKEFKTKTLLKRSVGHVFPVMGFQKDWIELHLGKFIGRRSWEESIWLEPEFIELVKKRTSPRRPHSFTSRRARVLK